MKYIFLSLLLSISNSCLSYQVKEVKFLVLDADTNDQIKDAFIHINGDPITENTYPLPQGSDSRIAIDVKVSAGDKYIQRELTIFLEGIKNEEKPIYKTYLAKNESGKIYTLGYVKIISELLNRKYADKAVVLLERVNSATNPGLKNSEYGVFLDYHLARGYYLNCTERFIDQCKNASDIFDNLNDSYDKKTKIFKSLQISNEELTDLKTKDFYLRMDYLRIKWNKDRNKYEDALNQLNDLIEKIEEDEEIPKTLKIKKEQLYTLRNYLEEKLNTKTHQL